MSMIECNLASGDGVKPIRQGTPLKETPVPSCRRFATRQPHKSETNRKKIQEALEQITAPPKSSPVFNRKRAQTMAEITPTKRKSVEMKLIGDSHMRSSLGRNEAAQRIYQQLLLNAWRRRRTQITDLSESTDRLKTQIKQLQMQVNLLQELRKSESLKRVEAAKAMQIQKKELESLLTTVQHLKTEKNQLNEEVERLQRKVEQLTADGKNLKNELLSSKSENIAYENRLMEERGKSVALMQDKEDLAKKVLDYEELSTDQIDTIYHLQRSLDSSESNLSRANINAGILEEEKQELSLKLQKECDLRNELQKQYLEKKDREELLERKVCHLHKNISLLRETKKKLLDDNTVLKQTLKELETAFKVEKEKKWWRNAAGVVLESLNTAAHVMLPALPNKINGYESISTNLTKGQG